MKQACLERPPFQTSISGNLHWTLMDPLLIRSRRGLDARPRYQNRKRPSYVLAVASRRSRSSDSDLVVAEQCQVIRRFQKETADFGLIWLCFHHLMFFFGLIFFRKPPTKTEAEKTKKRLLTLPGVLMLLLEQPSSMGQCCPGSSTEKDRKQPWPWNLNGYAPISYRISQHSHTQTYVPIYIYTLRIHVYIYIYIHTHVHTYIYIYMYTIKTYTIYSSLFKLPLVK